MNVLLQELKETNKIQEEVAEDLTRQINQDLKKEESLYDGEGFSYYGFWNNKDREWYSVQFKISGKENNNKRPNIGDRVFVFIDKDVPIFSDYISYSLGKGWHNTARKGYLKKGQIVTVIDTKWDIGNNKVWIKFKTE